jgi:3-dehydroquinate dehydratase-1
MLEMKGKTFGQGKPIICVPIMEDKKENILSEVARLVELGADMIEWRVDAFHDVNSLEAVKDVLTELEQLIHNTVFLFTFRSKKQGGLIELEEEKLYQLCCIAAESKAVDFIDVEYFEGNQVDSKISALQDMGVKVIASHHDFSKTPSREEMMSLLEQMKDSKADIVKMALMPQEYEDVLRLLKVTKDFHNMYPEQLIITMSMGKLGVISRITGEATGSCVTFGSGKTSSAPGQIPMDQLHDILDIIEGV